MKNRYQDKGQCFPELSGRKDRSLRKSSYNNFVTLDGGAEQWRFVLDVLTVKNY